MNYNPFSLEGKTILITGASSGIGQATAIECSKLGAKCVITGRNAERLQQTFEQLDGYEHQQIIADLSNQEGIDILAEKSPVLNGLVNNAGISITKPVAFYKESDLECVFKTNAFAPMLVVKSFLKKKKLASGCSIVFTSSLATMNSVLGNGIYGASKSALTSYMGYCAHELAAKNIRANTVHPGMIETKFIHGGTISEEDLAVDMKNYPLGRYGQPNEIAWAIIYLLSNASAWVTGTQMLIDGGTHLM